MAMAEFQWFVSRKSNDCKDVPEKTFTGTPIGRKDDKHFLCWRDEDRSIEWKGELFTIGECGENCCNLISPVGPIVEDKIRYY